MPDPITIEEAAELVAAWIDPAREAFALGLPVHLAFSPGDGTCYALTFVPPGGPSFVSPGEHPRLLPGDALLVMPIRRVAFPIAPDGDPVWPYVEEKLGTNNAPTILAVGLCWHLMVGGTVASAVRAFGPWLERLPWSPLSEWDRTMIAPAMAEEG